MKFFINYNFSKKIWGGGNQFLKALKKELGSSGEYAESPDDADAVIFNGYQEAWDLIKFWFVKGKRKIIYRLGPIISLHRKALKWKLVDYFVILVANIFVDVIVFQSRWSYEKAKKLGLWENKKYVIIGNAVDNSIFYKKEFQEKSPGEKIKLIYTSWSSNMKKGFKYLKYLDENLDFSKYQFTFVGNSPFQFKNIEVIKPLKSEELAKVLRDNDIFISPVEDDACSNALLEGLSCDLPSVALDSGGNPEIVKNGGVLFKGKTDFIEAINRVSRDLRYFRENISVETMSDIVQKYFKIFCI